MTISTERYITDRLDEYPVGPCQNCEGTIGHADLTRDEDWSRWPGGDSDVPLLSMASGTLTCASCEHSRSVKADTLTGSVIPVFESMTEVTA